MNLTEKNIKNVLVTGGASGLGAAIVKKMLAQKARVWVIDQHQGKESADDVNYIVADLASEHELDQAFLQLAESIDSLDALVLNAGQYLYAEMDKTDRAEMRQLTAVNYLAPYYCIQHSFKWLKAASPSNIVLIGSDQSLIGRTGNSAYAMTKAAIAQLARSLAIEFASYPIYVNCVCPSTMADTGMLEESLKSIANDENITQDEALKQFQAEIPGGRLIDPGNVANLVSFLCQGDHQISGTSIPVDAGFVATK